MKAVALLFFVAHCAQSVFALPPDQFDYNDAKRRIDLAKSAMLASIRTSWEQGAASAALLELDSPECSVFGATPFKHCDSPPKSTLQLALSAVVRQSADGRLSQTINDGLDGAALDGASSGPAVLLGSSVDHIREDLWQVAADAQLQYILRKVPRTSTGAISHRASEAQYWADGVYMGFPFIAAYGMLNRDQGLLHLAYDNCRLYREALLQSSPHGNLWAHVYSDDSKSFLDQGLWATGNAWAAKGMLHVLATIMKSDYSPFMTSEMHDLISWIKEILDGSFASLGPDDLIPNYIAGNSATFSDASASALLAGVAYRCAKLLPAVFGVEYTATAAKIRAAVLDRIDDLGVLSPVVDPLAWSQKGTLSAEAQAFSVMMFAAWRDWMGITSYSVD